MKIALAADHAGFELKESLKEFLEADGHEVIDFGAETEDPGDDYPDFVVPAAQAVAAGDVDKGIIIGGSGQAEAMAANRIKGVRAAVFYGGDEEILPLSREHNDANILSLGARFIDEDLAKEMAMLWLATEFSGDERHVRRIAKIDDLT